MEQQLPKAARVILPLAENIVSYIALPRVDLEIMPHEAAILSLLATE